MNSLICWFVFLLIALPIAAAAIVPLFGQSARRVSLWLALIHLGLTFAVIVVAIPVLEDRGLVRDEVLDEHMGPIRPHFVPGSEIGASQRTTWTLLSLSATPTPSGKAGPDIQFYVGIDGINLWLVALASFMLIPAILVSWDALRDRPGAYYGWLLLLQGAAIGAFLSYDVILFYAFFELTLIPVFFLIGRWGNSSGRRDAARKFFLYTLAGSLLTLIGLIGIVLTNPTHEGVITTSVPDLTLSVQQRLDSAFLELSNGRPERLLDIQATQFWLFLALIAGFLVKVPVWPFHTWLPSAYGEAPTGVAIFLSAILAKLGAFGILRFVLPLTPDAAIQYGLPVIGSLAAFGIVYAALCAYGQKDLRLLVAYSSISHLGFLVLGLFAFNAEGISGAVLHMMNHGLCTGALFAIVGFLFDRYRTTQIHRFGGLMGSHPNFAVVAFVLCLASIGLPGLNSFVSEMLMLAGLVNAENPRIQRLGLAVVAAFGILLSAWYILTMLQRMFFNRQRTPELVDSPGGDLSQRECVNLGLLAGLCLLLGLYPQPILDSMKWDVKQLAFIGTMARERVRGEPRPPDPPAQATQPVVFPKGPDPTGPGAKGGKKGKGKNSEDD